jgi:adenylyl-sulfate kinase
MSVMETRDMSLVEDDPHLLVIAPPHFEHGSALASLVRPAGAEAPGADELPSFRVTGVADLDHRSFNSTVLSARADVALIVVDATFGLDKRDRWGKALACLSGVPQLVLAVDNLTLVDGAAERFARISEEFAEQAAVIDCREQHVVAIDSSNRAGLAVSFPWYEGPSLRQLLAELRGRLLAARAARTETPPLSSDQFAVHLCWTGTAPMLPGRHFRMLINGQQAEAQVSALKYRINPETMDQQAATQLRPGEIGYANIALSAPVSFLSFEADREQGSFWLEDKASGERVAFGLIKHELRRATNIKWHALEVDKAARAAAKRQTPCVLWFTGLSGSGKSTVATIVDKKLHAMGKHAYLLDGDNVRHGLCRDLGFTDADRVENLRRIGETAKLFVDAGMIVLVSFISPFRSERLAARELLERHEFLEIFVDTPLAVCEARDPKGLYKKARAGQLKNFTGLDSPYEAPQNAEVVLRGAEMPAEQLADEVIAAMMASGLIEGAAE